MVKTSNERKTILPTLDSDRQVSSYNLRILVGQLKATERVTHDEFLRLLRTNYKEQITEHLALARERRSRRYGLLLTALCRSARR
jgi:hypothetical protein